MHEVSIAQNIINEIEDLISEGRIMGPVRSICLRIGQLTTVVHENLKFLFGILSRGTMLEGAQLKIEKVPIRAACRVCGNRFEISDARFLCAQCSSPEIEILSGREMEIEAVEVE